MRPSRGAPLLVRRHRRRLDAHGVGSLRKRKLADALQCRPKGRSGAMHWFYIFARKGSQFKQPAATTELTSLRTPDADAAPACHVGLPGSAGEIARNASRSDAVIRTHVPGRPHHAGARYATGERTRGARNLYDPVGHLHGASGGGRTWSGFCPKHSAPGAVEFSRSVCGRRGGSRRNA